MSYVQAKYTEYFDNMKPGQSIDMSKVKDVPALIAAAKTYIDNGGNMEFNGDWSVLRKLYPFKEEVERVFGK